MRHHAGKNSPPGPADWRTLMKLGPYLWAHRWRFFFAVCFLIGAKIATIGVPVLLKHIVDGLDASKNTVLVLPAALIVGYGLLRLATTLFTDLRDMIFAKVTQGMIRKVSIQAFSHLHKLSLRFHLERQTGGVTRDIERGSAGISVVINYLLFRIAPTLIEILMVGGILLVQFDWVFALITLAVLVFYIITTVAITEWRTKYRRKMNELESVSTTRAVDSLINYETVKYFGNEKFETDRYNTSMEHWQEAAVKSQNSLSLLNIAQAFIIATGVTLILWRASAGVVSGQLTLGDLVMINAFLIQIFMPLNFLGVMYREIKQSITDIERMFKLLTQNIEVRDKDNAPSLKVAGGAVKFEHVGFAYDAERPILHEVSFEIPAGRNVAVVGASGSGKSTLVRLLFRFYDVTGGRISIDGQDIRDVTQESLRAAIGIVPQDTVLFNDTLYYNIAYGKPGASREEVVEAARAAHILHFIESLPKGWDTIVGERGLKLSGGEKQRVAIARTLLKNPAILLLDEATSALDTESERIVQLALANLMKNRTTVVIAHRLSTVQNATRIVVLDRGRVAEIGTHDELLRHNGLYQRLHAMQFQDVTNV